MSKNNQEAVIVEGFRTPFVKSGKNFEHMSAEELGSHTLRELLERTHIDPKEIEGVILGNTVNSMDSPNLGRIVSLRAGLSPSISATTVQRMDISSLESVVSATIKITAGLANTLIAGGVESMSQMPIFLNSGITKIIKQIIQSETWKEKAKQTLSLRLSDLKLHFVDKTILIDSFSGLHQGQTAEALSDNFHISRKEQDEFTLMSFEKACLAQKKGKWKEEIVPVFPPTNFELVEEDTELENQPSLHQLSELPSFFDKDYSTVTSGNSSFPADGAALLLIMSKEKAQSLGYQPLASIYSFACIGAEPRTQGLGPVYASEKALKKANLQIKDINLFEINEAFSAQTLACLKAFESSTPGAVDPEKCNVNGGALALGNPLSATPARMILSLTKEMKRQQVEWGLVTAGMCEGQASALILKNISD